MRRRRPVGAGQWRGAPPHRADAAILSSPFCAGRAGPRADAEPDTPSVAEDLHVRQQVHRAHRLPQRLIANTAAHKPQELQLPEKERTPPFQSEPQMFLQPKRISDDSRDAEMCEKSDDEEDLNVDVENDDALCPVDLTRRQDKFAGAFEGFVAASAKGSDAGGDFGSYKDEMKRAESVCSDVSRSESPRDPSPSVVPHQNRRLAFSVENILDPNKFTGRQSVYGDGICCWKPLDGSRESPDYDESDAGGSSEDLMLYVDM
ncbi:hypothetical protein NQ318_018485 [Aromia moschata]|uniref:Uncharacterized protein n=1 Tax=Aromia moschata TaxID=1265417 RepID=A0AAV8YN32_9CUCU|nr:hypothetical protein NQ318_018485 [Aromia moschata]